MARPGVNVLLQDAPGQVSVETDTGAWFASGLTDRGPTTPTAIRSLSQFVSVFGVRQTYSLLYDAVESFFQEGGAVVYISRVVGPSATSGTHNLLDTNSATSLVVTAIGPGAWSANYKVAVVAGTVGGTFAIHITDSSNNVLEDSGNLADQQSAINWSQNSSYVRITLGSTALVPVTASGVALSAGTDDRASITDTQWLNALALITDDFGPGQVSQPGRTTTTAYDQVIAHATSHNRVAVLDLPDSGSAGTLESAISTETSRFGAAFGPWIIVPGITSGTTRTVPPSGMVAGMIARNDVLFGPNKPSAGNAGVSRFATGVSQTPWDDTTRQALNDAGCNIIRPVGQSVKVYGWRSLTDPINDQSWIDFGNARLYMSLNAEFKAGAENFMFDEIDGQDGQTIGGFHDMLGSICLDHYTRGELFGNTPGEAFVVDTGHSVNTLVTIAALELHAVVSVKMAPFAEYIQIIVAKQPIS